MYSELEERSYIYFSCFQAGQERIWRHIDYVSRQIYKHV